MCHRDVTKEEQLSAAARASQKTDAFWDYTLNKSPRSPDTEMLINILRVELVSYKIPRETTCKVIMIFFALYIPLQAPPCILISIQSSKSKLRIN